MRRSIIGLARIVWLALVMGLLSVPVAAQSAAPSMPPPTIAPTPTPDSGIDWPPMGFAGTPPAQPFSFTSDCGVWGQDPITLRGEGGGWAFDLVVTFDTYDQEAFQWFGTVTGTSNAPNGTVTPIDEGALIYYDMDGHWILVASWAAQIPAHGCAPMSPDSSGAPG
jgi:hypothetical protein